MAYRNNSDNSGCGCLILIVIAIAFFVNKCDDSDSSSSSTTTTTQKTESNYTSQESSSDSQEYSVADELSEEDKQYENNSLSTGAAPYTACYGRNYKCPYEQCSGIKVTAPGESDIKAGATLFLPVPDGTYQTFFYYGTGWNPNKQMSCGIKGGFVKDEIFSKDNPQDIYSGILTYVLQLQRDGNFHTKSSNRSEMF